MLKSENSKIIMPDFAILTDIFNALGNKRRLKILERIENGISNPGEIAKNMKISRSTVEKHLRVLKKANIIEKVPGLSSKGNLRVYYSLKKIVKKFLYTSIDLLKETCSKI